MFHLLCGGTILHRSHPY
uniref:Uncharacterized protein n=1 Tax=Anguilla anguilla TaxID=7936 RepID=A0A0E9Q196_ANGAN